ncbi:hypothetical protein Val02_45280 [Virgisporangium aliadipatigenens]|uniref:Uncharacterized protein n=1 Tax=Virgisporangium aliadipatigenens TaxID=741659 RepID=A0A8J3YNF1_9ACTN|nr:hypothetical protein [Virgisporangium aliadipatigenens]GIJ47642.1 hypothetical protein Val02_45280 [Virgisporangium aliadipatigenens]
MLADICAGWRIVPAPHGIYLHTGERAELDTAPGLDHALHTAAGTALPRLVTTPDALGGPLLERNLDRWRDAHGGLLVDLSGAPGGPTRADAQEYADRYAVRIRLPGGVEVRPADGVQVRPAEGVQVRPADGVTRVPAPSGSAPAFPRARLDGDAGGTNGGDPARAAFLDALGRALVPLRGAGGWDAALDTRAAALRPALRAPHTAGAGDRALLAAALSDVDRLERLAAEFRAGPGGVPEVLRLLAAVREPATVARAVRLDGLLPERDLAARLARAGALLRLADDLAATLRPVLDRAVRALPDRRLPALLDELLPLPAGAEALHAAVYLAGQRAHDEVLRPVRDGARPLADAAHRRAGLHETARGADPRAVRAAAREARAAALRGAAEQARVSTVDGALPAAEAARRARTRAAARARAAALGDVPVRAGGAGLAAALADARRAEAERLDAAVDAVAALFAPGGPLVDAPEVDRVERIRGRVVAGQPLTAGDAAFLAELRALSGVADPMLTGPFEDAAGQRLQDLGLRADARAVAVLALLERARRWVALRDGYAAHARGSPAPGPPSTVDDDGWTALADVARMRAAADPIVRAADAVPPKRLATPAAGGAPVTPRTTAPVGARQLPLDAVTRAVRATDPAGGAPESVTTAAAALLGPESAGSPRWYLVTEPDRAGPPAALLTAGLLARRMPELLGAGLSLRTGDRAGAREIVVHGERIGTYTSTVDGALTGLVRVVVEHRHRGRTLATRTVHLTEEVDSRSGDTATRAPASTPIRSAADVAATLHGLAGVRPFAPTPAQLAGGTAHLDPAALRRAHRYLADALAPPRPDGPAVLSRPDRERLLDALRRTVSAPYLDGVLATALTRTAVAHRVGGRRLGTRQTVLSTGIRLYDARVLGYVGTARGPAVRVAVGLLLQVEHGGRRHAVRIDDAAELQLPVPAALALREAFTAPLEVAPFAGGNLLPAPGDTAATYAAAAARAPHLPGVHRIAGTFDTRGGRLVAGDAALDATSLAEQVTTMPGWHGQRLLVLDVAGVPARYRDALADALTRAAGHPTHVLGRDGDGGWVLHGNRTGRYGTDLTAVLTTELPAALRAPGGTPSTVDTVNPVNALNTLSAVDPVDTVDSRYRLTVAELREWAVDGRPVEEPAVLEDLNRLAGAVRAARERQWRRLRARLLDTWNRAMGAQAAADPTEWAGVVHADLVRFRGDLAADVTAQAQRRRATGRERPSVRWTDLEPIPELDEPAAGEWAAADGGWTWVGTGHPTALPTGLTPGPTGGAAQSRRWWTLLELITEATLLSGSGGRPPVALAATAALRVDRLVAFAASWPGRADGSDLPRLYEFLRAAQTGLTGERVEFRLQAFRSGEDGSVVASPVLGERGPVLFVHHDAVADVYVPLWTSRWRRTLVGLATLSDNGVPYAENAVRAALLKVPAPVRADLTAAWDALSERVRRTWFGAARQPVEEPAGAGPWLDATAQAVERLHQEVAALADEITNAVDDTAVARWFHLDAANATVPREAFRVLRGLMDETRGTRRELRALVHEVGTVSRRLTRSARWRVERHRLTGRDPMPGVPIGARRRLLQLVEVAHTLDPERLTRGPRADRVGYLTTLRRLFDALRADVVHVDVLAALVAGWRGGGAPDVPQWTDLRALVAATEDAKSPGRRVELADVRRAWEALRGADPTTSPAEPEPHGPLALPNDAYSATLTLPGHMRDDQLLGAARAGLLPGERDALMDFVRRGVGGVVPDDDPGLAALKHTLDHRFRDGLVDGATVTVRRADGPVEVTLHLTLVNRMTAIRRDIGSRRIDTGTESSRTRGFVKRYTRSRVWSLPFSFLLNASPVGALLSIAAKLIRNQPTTTMGGASGVLDQKLLRSGLGSEAYHADLYSALTVTSLVDGKESTAPPRHLLRPGAVLLEIPEYMLKPTAYRPLPPPAGTPPAPDEFDLNGRVPRTFTVDDVGGTKALFLDLLEAVPAAKRIGSPARDTLRELAERRTVANYVDQLADTYLYSPTLYDDDPDTPIGAVRTRLVLGRANRISVTEDGEVLIRHSNAGSVALIAATSVTDGGEVSLGVGPGALIDAGPITASAGLVARIAAAYKRSQGAKNGGAAADRHMADAGGPTALYLVQVAFVNQAMGAQPREPVHGFLLIRMQVEEALRLAAPETFTYRSTSNAPRRTDRAPTNTDDVQPPTYLARRHPRTIGPSITADVSRGRELHDLVVTKLRGAAPELLPDWATTDPKRLAGSPERFLSVVTNYRSLGEGITRSAFRSGLSQVLDVGLRFRFRMLSVGSVDHYLLTLAGRLGNRRHRGTIESISPADITIMSEELDSSHGRTEELSESFDVSGWVKSAAKQTSGHVGFGPRWTQALGQSGEHGQGIVTYRLSYSAAGVEVYEFDLDVDATLAHYRRPRAWRRIALVNPFLGGFRFTRFPDRKLFDAPFRSTVTLWSPSDRSWRQPDTDRRPVAPVPEQTLGPVTDLDPEVARTVIEAPRSAHFTPAFHPDALDQPPAVVVDLVTGTVQALGGNRSLTEGGTPVDQVLTDRYAITVLRGRLSVLTAPGGLMTAGLMGDGAFVDWEAGVRVRLTAGNWRVEDVVPDLHVEEYHQGRAGASGARSRSDQVTFAFGVGVGGTPETPAGRFSGRATATYTFVDWLNRFVRRTNVSGAHERNRAHTGRYQILRADVTWTALASARPTNLLTELAPRALRPSERRRARQVTVPDALYLDIADADVRDLALLPHERPLPGPLDAVWMPPEPLRTGLGLGLALLDRNVDLIQLLDVLRTELERSLPGALPRDLAADVTGSLRHVTAAVTADGIHAFIDNLLDGGVPIPVRVRSFGHKRVARVLFRLRLDRVPVFEDLRPDIDIESYHIGTAGQGEGHEVEHSHGLRLNAFGGEGQQHGSAQGLMFGTMAQAARNRASAVDHGRELRVYTMTMNSGPAARYAARLVPSVQVDFQDGRSWTPRLPDDVAVGVPVIVPESSSVPGFHTSTPSVAPAPPTVTLLPPSEATPRRLAAWKAAPEAVRLPKQFGMVHVWGAGGLRTATERLMTMLARGGRAAPGDDLAGYDRDVGPIHIGRQLRSDYRGATGDQNATIWSTVNNLTLAGTFHLLNDAGDADRDGRQPPVDGAAAGLSLPVVSVLSPTGGWRPATLRVLANVRNVRLHNVTGPNAESVKLEHRTATEIPRTEYHSVSDSFDTSGAFQTSLSGGSQKDQTPAKISTEPAATLTQADKAQQEDDYSALSGTATLVAGEADRRATVGGKSDRYLNLRDITHTYEFTADVEYRLVATLGDRTEAVEVTVSDGLRVKLRQHDAIAHGLITEETAEELRAPVADMDAVIETYKDAGRTAMHAQGVMATAMRDLDRAVAAERVAWARVEDAAGRIDGPTDGLAAARWIVRLASRRNRVADEVNRLVDVQERHELARAAAVRALEALREVQAEVGATDPTDVAATDRNRARLAEVTGAEAAARTAWERAWRELSDTHADLATRLRAWSASVALAARHRPAGAHPALAAADAWVREAERLATDAAAAHTERAAYSAARVAAHAAATAYVTRRREFVAHVAEITRSAVWGVTSMSRSMTDSLSLGGASGSTPPREQWLSAPDWERSAELWEEHRGTLLRRGELARMHDALDRAAAAGTPATTVGAQRALLRLAPLGQAERAYRYLTAEPHERTGQIVDWLADADTALLPHLLPLITALAEARPPPTSTVVVAILRATAHAVAGELPEARAAVETARHDLTLELRFAWLEHLSRVVAAHRGAADRLDVVSQAVASCG